MLGSVDTHSWVIIFYVSKRSNVVKLISLKVAPNNTGNPIDELREEVSKPAGSPTILMEEGAKSNVLTISVQTVV